MVTQEAVKGRTSRQEQFVRKVGIMGGTFNPIHLGHLLLAENARSSFDLDEVWFLPSGCSYMKSQEGMADGAVRLHMTGLACRDNPYFRVSSLEVDRGGYTYTADTLCRLTEENPDTSFYFIVGADNLLTMESWKDPEVIFQKAGILAAVREGCDREKLRGQAAYLNGRYDARVHLIPAGTIEISSSDIRARIRAGRSIRYMVPEDVRRYIEKNGLYEGGRTAAEPLKSVLR